MPVLDLPALVVLYLIHFSTLSHAQVVTHGQIFTNALTIVDKPVTGATIVAGRDMDLVIDVSGDGRLANWQEASIPGSSYDTRYDSLEVYLVSSDTSTNLTVSRGLGLLTREQGSRVKHLSWSVPTCISTGNYNLTIYESSHINGQAFFSITPLSLVIQNASPSREPCGTGINIVEAQPQLSSPPTNPWIDNPVRRSVVQPPTGLMSVMAPPDPIPEEVIAVVMRPADTLQPSGVVPLPPHIPSIQSSRVVTVTVFPPAGTVTATPVTVTSTIVSLSTVTAVMASSSSGDFFPVNSSTCRWKISGPVYLVVFFASAMVWLSP